jgi:hypothetical protein
MEGNRAITWRTSSYSGNSGGNCVEVGTAAQLIAVRDSKDPDGSVLAFAANAWAAFAERVKAGT